MDKVLLGKRIREARNSKGFTQEVLSEKADIGVAYLGEIERGIKLPSMKVFIRLIEALDISADYVLRHHISSGENYVFDEITKKLTELTPQQRKTVTDIIDAYINNL